MKITLNGEQQTFEGVNTVEDLLVQSGHAGQRLAVELNGEIVPKSEHGTTSIKPGDAVEIVIAVGGG